MSAPMTTNVVSSSAKRSWGRFTLRALLLVVLAAGVFCGWVAYRARFLQTQYTWVKEFQSRHRNAITLKPISNEWFWRPLIGDAAVTVKRAFLNGYSYEDGKFILTKDVLERVRAWTEVEQLVLSGPAITDETVQFVRRLHTLTLLGLEDTSITDEGTACLVHMHGLKEFAIVTHPDRMRVPEGAISGASLKNIVGGKDLKVLGLAMPITDEDLELIARNCPNLEHLELHGSRVTGRGLARLRALPRLVHLSISRNSSIDDDAARQLFHLPVVKQLFLDDTRVSRRGEAALKARLPRTWVNVRESQVSRVNR